MASIYLNHEQTTLLADLVQAEIENLQRQASLIQGWQTTPPNWDLRSTPEHWERRYIEVLETITKLEGIADKLARDTSGEKEARAAFWSGRA